MPRWGNKVQHTPGRNGNIAMCGITALYMVDLATFRAHPNRCSNCCRALGDTLPRSANAPGQPTTRDRR